MSEHSVVMGGSNAEQRINCPGSYKLELDAPPETESEYAREGSMLHAAMELLLTEDPDSPEALEAVLNELLGQSLGYGSEDPDKHIEITQDHLDNKLRPAFMAWVEVIEKYGIEEYEIEVKMHYAPDILPGAYGTVDVLARNHTENWLIILDWKFGDGVYVPVKGNFQFTFYAGAALYDEDPDVQALVGKENPEKIILVGVQPRNGYDGPVWQAWETDINYVEDFIDMANDALEAAESPKPAVKPGSHCRWCRAKVTCPANQAMVVGALNTQPSHMTTQELGKWLEFARRVNDWAKDVINYARHEMLDNGVNVPGSKLVRGRSNRKWRDEKEATKALKASGLKPREYNKPVQMISPTQIEKQFPELYPTIEETHVVKPEGKITVVADTDPRPAIVDGFALLDATLTKAGVNLKK